MYRKILWVIRVIICMTVAAIWWIVLTQIIPKATHKDAKIILIIMGLISIFLAIWLFSQVKSDVAKHHISRMGKLQRSPEQIEAHQIALSQAARSQLFALIVAGIILVMIVYAVRWFL